MKQTANKSPKKLDALLTNTLRHHAAIQPVHDHEPPRSVETVDECTLAVDQDFSHLPINSDESARSHQSQTQSCPFSPQRCPFGGACETCRPRVQATQAMGIQRKATNNDKLSDVPPIVHEVLRSPGQPLDLAIRDFFEPRFGYDFSPVRIHADGQAANAARSVRACAYTIGSHIFFGDGQYAPATTQGRRLLAHELTHVVQQNTATSASMPSVQRQPAGGDTSCGTDFKQKFLGRINGESSKTHRGVPRMYYARPPDRVSAGQTVAPLVTGTELSVGQTGGYGNLWRAVCTATPNTPVQILWVLGEYLTDVDQERRNKKELKKKSKEKQTDAEPTDPNRLYDFVFDPITGQAAMVDTQSSENFIDNRVQMVGRFLGGPTNDYLLYMENIGLQGSSWNVVDYGAAISGKTLPIRLEPSRVDIAGSTSELRQSPFPTRDLAMSAIVAAGGGYHAYYITEQGLIVPTVFSPVTTPRILNMIHDVEANRAAEATAAANELMIMAIGIGAVAVVGVITGSRLHFSQRRKTPAGEPPSEPVVASRGQLTPSEPVVASRGQLTPSEPVVASRGQLTRSTTSIPVTGSRGNPKSSARIRAKREPSSPQPGSWRGRPQIQNGNLNEGWMHIESRHVTGTHPSGAGDLFKQGTTRIQLQRAAEVIVKRGTRISEPNHRIQTFERRITINGKSDKVRVCVDTIDGKVITIFPVRGGG